MKCENCGKNEVTFVYQSNINGKITEKHLCSACAEKLGYSQKIAAHSQRMMQSFFGGSFFDDFFTPMPSLFGGLNRMLEDPFDDFFADMPALTAGEPAQVQPEKTKQQPDLVEKEEQSRFARRREINALRMEMRKAVRQENFERAAELRDQLRAMANETNDKESE